MFIVLFGFVLPLVALAVEMVSGMCAEVFFNPIPKAIHIASLLVIPFGHLWILRHQKTYLQKSKKKLTILSLVQGISLGISLFYTLVFLPITPISFLAIVFLGLGFLSLSPLLSFIAGLFYFSHSSKTYFNKNILETRPTITFKHVFYIGFLLGFFLLPMHALRTTQLTRNIQMALSTNPLTSQKAIQKLKTKNKHDFEKALFENMGVRDHLRSPLGGNGRISWFNMFSFSDRYVHPDHNPNRISTQDAKRIFFWVTGSTTLPSNPRKLYRSWGVYLNETFDNMSIKAKVKKPFLPIERTGLHLSASTINGHIDENDGVGYLEWVMTVKNHDDWQREALMKLHLPPHAAMSRLTLWINGVEQEAAYAEKKKVTQAYQKIVSRKKDPVLATQKSPGQIDLRMFPVPRNGGIMKFKIGLSFSGFLGADPHSASLTLPTVHGENVHIAQNVVHDITFESKTKLLASSTWIHQNRSKPKFDLFHLKSRLLHENFQMLSNRILRWAQDQKPRYVNDTDAKTKTIIHQRIHPHKLPPKPITLVIDPSDHVLVGQTNGFENLLRELVDQNLVSNVIYAGSHHPYIALYAGHSQSSSDRLKFTFQKGGFDSAQALAKALELANVKSNVDQSSQKKSSLKQNIVWIHGSGTDVGQSTEALKKALVQIQGPVDVYTMALNANHSSTFLNSREFKLDVIKLPRSSRLDKDVRRHVSYLSGQEERYAFKRKKITSHERSKMNASTLGTRSDNQHIARLWAYDHIVEQIKDEANIESAIKLGQHHRLVTPVTGAVVLENKVQFKDAGLKQVKPQSVPSIPEPETYALLMVLIFMMGLAHRYKYKWLPKFS